MSDFDVIVLSGGAPGEHCAGAIAARGLRVAVVERGLVGGECSYWACIPSKSLLRPGEAVQGASGVGASAEVNVEAALQWRDYLVSDYSDAGQERRLADRASRSSVAPAGRPGPGWSKWTAPATRARHVVVATGSDPVVPPVAGLDALEGVLGTREATAMKSVPRRLIVLGGGSAGVEIAQAVRRLGGEAVLVEGADRPIPREPAPLGEALRRDGIELRLGVHAAEALRDGDGYVLKLSDGTEVQGERLLVATGRRPRVEGIGLETVGVEAERHGIRVDEYLRAGERIWAIGDVNGIWPLTHVGGYGSDVVAANIAGASHPANYEAVPRVTETDPEAAAVGAAEASHSATTLLSEVPKTATYTHAYAESKGFLTLPSDGTRLAGALCPRRRGRRVAPAGDARHTRPRPPGSAERHHPAVPSFSGIFDAAFKALRMQIASTPPPAPMQAQMARP